MMAFFDGDMTPAVWIWRWEERRVWSPFCRCQSSGKFLFLRKAHYGSLYVDWEYDRDMWLSTGEFVFAKLKGEFDG